MTELTEPVSAYDVAAAVRAVITATHAANSCIETTRLLISVLARIGVRATPVAVDVDVFNAAAYRAREDHLATEEWPADAKWLRIAPTGDPNGWPGHLVAIVKVDGTRRLIDASASQFHRPGLLEIPGPVITTLPSLWTPHDPWFVRLDSGAVLGYAPIPPGDARAKRWRTFPAWTRTPGWYDQMADSIIGEAGDD